MRSRLYTGTMAHVRTTPAHNAFRYPIYYLGIDLDELDDLDARLRHFGHNGASLTSLWDRDHGPRDGSPLRPWIEAVCARAGIDIADGRVMLLTFPRVLGARFYPVSFWYCFSRDGVVRAVLAEVHNTYRDHHNYLLHDDGVPFDFSAVHVAEKRFYVSPFMPIEGVTYEFTVSEPGDRLGVSIRDIVAGHGVLTAGFELAASELTDAALRSTIVAHGPVSVVALLLIHWQALKLFTKRVPFFPHTPPPSEDISL